MSAIVLFLAAAGGMAMAQEDGAGPPFDRRLVDALLAGSEDARELIRSRPRDAHEIFHGYLDSAIALELDGSRNRVRIAWDIGERLAPLYDAVRGGQALTEALIRYREFREKHAARKAQADRKLGSAEAAFRAGRAGEAGAVIAPAEEALGIYREIGDPRGAARAHRLLAEAPRDGSDIEAVVRHLTEAARLHGAAGNGWEEIDALARLAEALARSGAFLLARGEYGRALDRLLASLDATSGRADLGAARKRALLQVAGAYDEVGLFEPAESCLQEALHLDRATGGDLEADCLSLLARIALDRGETSRAEELLRAAMALPAERRRERGRVERLLALARAEPGGAGELHGELQLLETARAAYAASGSLLDQGLCEVDLGAALQRRGRIDEARELFERALDRSSDFPEVAWRARMGLGEILELAGETGAAIARYRGAVEAAEDLLARLGGPLLRRNFLQGREGPYHRLIDALASRGEVLEALEVAERIHGRARTERSQEGLVAALARLEPEQGRKLEQLTARLAAANEAVDQARDPGALRQAVAERDASRREYEDLLTRASAVPQPSTGAERKTSVQPPEASVADAIEALGRSSERAAALVYVVTRRRTHLWVVAGNGVTHHSIDIDEEGLRRLIDRLRAPLRSFREGTADLSHVAFDVEAARRLHELLVAPAVRGATGAVESPRWTIVADGPLHHLPFEALVVDGRRGPVDHRKLFAEYRGCRYLVEQRAISYAPSLRHLAAGAAAGTGASRYAGGPVLVLADPGSAGDPSPAGGELAGAPWDRWRSRPGGGLPSAATEARAIASVLGAGRVKALAGDQATREAFFQGATGAAIIHVAAHAWVDDFAPLFSGFQVARPAGRDAIEAHDILRLDWHSSGKPGPLVVLSGCETAQGPLRRGEGLESLARAFLQAGASGVVASLWRVDDSAALLMDRFYRELEFGAPAALALQSAKIELLRRLEGKGFAYSLPYFWAPFVLAGERY